MRGAGEVPLEAGKAAIEAAMEAYYANGEEPHEGAMRAALEAAAPYMLVRAWNEGWDAGLHFKPNNANPYKTTN